VRRFPSLGGHGPTAVGRRPCCALLTGVGGFFAVLGAEFGTTLLVAAFFTGVAVLMRRRGHSDGPAASNAPGRSTLECTTADGRCLGATARIARLI
jgi:hypothetical protein